MCLTYMYIYVKIHTNFIGYYNYSGIYFQVLKTGHQSYISGSYSRSAKVRDSASTGP